MKEFKIARKLNEHEKIVKKFELVPVPQSENWKVRKHEPAAPAAEAARCGAGHRAYGINVLDCLATYGKLYKVAQV